MKKQYHISEDGTPKTCNAKIKPCRYGGANSHFSTLDEAQEFSDRKNELELEYLELIKHEENITNDLKYYLEDSNSYLAGLEYRTKTLSSTVEKILIRKEANSINELYDVIRYTVVSETDEYYKQKFKTIEKLKNDGYRVVAKKDTWGRPGYKGINMKLENSKGIKFELQFHTEESLLAKTQAHHKYELARLPSTSEEERKKLILEMDEIFNKINIPQKY